jgi:two-component system, sensor histidine kinase and response regulator
MVTSADRQMLSKLRVLVVDDQDMVALLVHFLQDMDVRNIYRATDGAAAIDQLNTVPLGVQLVICDSDTPKQNGLEILKYVRKTFHDMPFVMLDAHVTAEAITAARAEGVTEYLTKPFNVATLQERVVAAAQVYYGADAQIAGDSEDGDDSWEI